MDTIKSSLLKEAHANGHKNITSYMRAKKRAKAMRTFWNEWGKPFAIAVIALPFIYIFLVAFIIALQSLTGEWNMYNY